MSLLRAALLALPLLVLGPVRGAALAPTLLSASPLEPGQNGVHGAVGFPWLDVRLARGVLPGFDLTLAARVAWADIQRIGLSTRWRFATAGDSAFALRTAIDGWLGRPATQRWIDITGEQELTATAALVWSVGTPRGTVLSFDAALLAVATTRPRLDPLAGTPPPLAFGVNSALRAAAEVPHESGLLLTVQVGVDLHLSGFDEAIAMPAFALGVGWR